MFFYSLILNLFVMSALWCADEVGISSSHASRVELSREQSERRALPLMLGLVGEQSSCLKAVGKQLAYDLGYSGQCVVTMRSFQDIQKKEAIKKICGDGFQLAIFVQEQGKNSFEVRLYDTSRSTMVMGKKFSFTHNNERFWAHTIADSIWPVLTGNPGIFLTKIAYCKRVSGKKGAKVKHVYVCDFDGSNAEWIVQTPTVNVAPRWNRDPKRPLLFYSEYTNDNVRLMAVNMRKQRKIVSNLDGITMVPAFSADGKSVVYCASRGKGSCQLFLIKDGVVRQLTHNTGNNVSPTFSRDGSLVYFCSDYETGLPQLYTYTLASGVIKRITDGGYCASPSCSMLHDKVAYAKMIDGAMQLMLYDPVKKTHNQLTYGVGNKEECSWSPCGTYLVYVLEEKDKSSIVSLNIQTHQSKVITSAKDLCSYPSWSPVYDQIPLLG